jgi:hypothetical protein
MDDNELDEIQRLRAEKERLTGEVARLQVSKRTSVPVSMLAAASDEASCQALADQALAWRADATGHQTPQAQPAPTGAVSPSPYKGVPQVSRQGLESMTPEQIMAAAKAGMLTGQGVGIPNRDAGTQRNGRHV